MWKIHDIIPKKTREKWDSEAFNKYLESLTIEEIKKFAITQNSKLNAKEEQIGTLSSITATANWYLSHPEEAKDELETSLIDAGFWVPMLTNFIPFNGAPSEEFLYYITAVNHIGETKLLGPLVKNKNLLSFSVSSCQTVPINFWNVYQIKISDVELENGDYIMKIPFIKSNNNIFGLNIKHAKKFGETNIIMCAVQD